METELDKSADGANSLRVDLPLTQMVGSVESDITVVQELLNIKKLSQLSIELTSSCNLACVYCHFAPLSRRGNDAEIKLVEEIIEFAESFPIDIVTMSGDAEVTLYEGWTEVARQLLKAGVKLRTISNFSKGIFTDKEVETLSRFSEILISLDTPRPEILKKIRYRADLRTITLNMQRVRASAIEQGLEIPNFICNVVLHDKNVMDINKMTAFAIANGFAIINMVRFVDLEEVPGGKNDLRDNPNALRVYPISTIDKLTAAKGVNSLMRALETAEGKINLSLGEDILEELNQVLGVDQAPKSDDVRQDLTGQAKRTKLCLMPWDYLSTFWNGDVPPCCIVKGTFVDNALQTKLIDVVNGAELKDWRRTLLTGDLKSECVSCTYRPDTDTVTLEGIVREHLSAYGTISKSTQ